MKKLYGQRAYVQSAGVKNDMEVDGFSVAVCQELGIELSRHRSRSFEEMREWGDDLSQFDLIVALSPASQRMALEIWCCRVRRTAMIPPTTAKRPQLHKKRWPAA